MGEIWGVLAAVLSSGLGGTSIGATRFVRHALDPLAIGVVQLDREVDVAAVTAAAVQRGVWLRPFRDLIYTMPPYVIEQDDLARVSEAIVDAARVASG